MVVIRGQLLWFSDSEQEKERTGVTFLGFLIVHKNNRVPQAPVSRLFISVQYLELSGIIIWLFLLQRVHMKKTSPMLLYLCMLIELVFLTVCVNELERPSDYITWISANELERTWLFDSVHEKTAPISFIFFIF